MVKYEYIDFKLVELEIQRKVRNILIWYHSTLSLFFYLAGTNDYICIPCNLPIHPHQYAWSVYQIILSC